MPNLQGTFTWTHSNTYDIDQYTHCENVTGAAEGEGVAEFLFSNEDDGMVPPFVLRYDILDRGPTSTVALEEHYHRL